MADVTVALPTLNEERYLERCLDSLEIAIENCDKHSFEFLVLDSHSEDETQEIARNHEIVDHVHLVEKGIIKARHQGFKEASGDIVISVDADSKYNSDYFANLLEPFEKYEDTVISYGPAFGEKLMNIDAVNRIITQYFLEYFTGRFWVSGSNRAVDREAYFECGGYQIEKDGESVLSVMIEEQYLFPLKMKEYGRIEFVSNAQSYQSARHIEQLLLLDRKEGGVQWNYLNHYHLIEKIRSKLPSIRRFFI